jgi:antitoxin HigA-1
MERTMSRSRIITEYDPPRIVDGVEVEALFSPLHPGEMLDEEFMKPLGLSAGQVAKACNVPRTRIERIVRGELGISADTALRLARLFDMTPEFWMNLQKHFELETAKLELADTIDAIKPLDRAA